MSEKDENELENLRRLLDVSQECVRDLRARLAAAESERDRIKALVADAPMAAYQYRLEGKSWNYAGQHTINQCLEYNAQHPEHPQFQHRELIVRPKLEPQP